MDTEGRFAQMIEGGLTPIYKILYKGPAMADRNPVEFRGSSLDDIRAFPDSARHEAGHEIDLVQQGYPADDWKPLHSIGVGAKKIGIRDAAGAFRVIYVPKFADAVYVLLQDVIVN
jgi:phage-related protein